MKDFIQTIFLFLTRLKKVEDNLRVYNGYLHYSLFKWIIVNKIPIRLAYKIFKKIKVYSSREIRDSIRSIILSNQELFDSPKTYITSFGQPDIIYKSGYLLLYELCHSFKKYENKVIPQWKIPGLPADSNIIFIDDLIGTGMQSTTYIKDISSMLNPSHQAYLFCICATEEGLNLINDTTIFIAEGHTILNKKEHHYLDKECNYFTYKEKQIILDMMEMIKSKNDIYNIGLLLAFVHSTPNNTIPIIWKDKYPYKKNKIDREWLALLPRYY